MNERVSAWRSGIWKVTQKHLKNADLMDVVKTFVYGSRLLPRASFAAFWSKAFAWLEEEGEDALVAAYQRNYFELNSDNQWWAEWAGSMDNTAASFYVGSQPQESWHKHRLRVALGDMRLEASEVVTKLGRLMSSRTAQAELRQEMWYDVPAGEWVRSCVDAGNFVLKNEKLFAREGNAWCMREGFSAETLPKLRTELLHPQLQVVFPLYVQNVSGVSEAIVIFTGVLTIIRCCHDS